MAEFNPAPKPSQKARAAKASAAKATDNLPAADDAVSGELTYTAEFLRNNPAKRKELLSAPDGTPGKDVAERVEAAAPIVNEAVKHAKEWSRLHGKAAQVTKALAEQLARLRMVYRDKQGRPDMRGTSLEYREAAALIYEKAGLAPDEASTAQGAVRYHLGDAVRNILREHEMFANGDEKKYRELCEYYRYNPESTLSRQKERRAVKAAVPALKLPQDDPATAWTEAVQYAQRALTAPGDADPSDLTDDARKALRDTLTAVRDRAEELLATLDDDA